MKVSRDAFNTSDLAINNTVQLNKASSLGSSKLLWYNKPLLLAIAKGQQELDRFLDENISHLSMSSLGKLMKEVTVNKSSSNGLLSMDHHMSKVVTEMENIKSIWFKAKIGVSQKWSSNKWWRSWWEVRMSV